MNILVVAAHPDDETLGAGGVMAKHIESGDNVSVLILGTGLTSRDQEKKSEISSLRTDSKKALSILGVNDVEFLDFPDNSFDSVPLLEIIKSVERKIKEVKPVEIFTHYQNDLNIDHKITFQAVLTAARPINEYVKKMLCFEVASSTEWNTEQSFNPNCFVDISGQLNKKLKALDEYKTEMRNFPHPRSNKYVEALAKVRGGSANMDAAEAFVIVRELIEWDYG